MEVFAGFAEHTDHEVGRLVERLEALGELDNTLFFYIVGDNGASAEGGPEGAYNEMMALNGIPATFDQMIGHIEDWGGPSTFPHYAIGWAWATNAPFQWTKQIASHFGGTRNGMALQWPARVKAKGEIRSQFHHVIDVAPTALEAAGLPEPRMVNGVEQRMMDGVSMLYTVDDAKAPDRRKTQYFEMFGNRAIYHEGWVAAARHSIPWVLLANPPLADDTWELYNVEEDFSQADDLAAQNPEKLKELQALFMQEAERNHVLPIDDRRAERFNAAIAGRPDLLGGRRTMTVYDGMTGIMENAFINVKGVRHSVTAEVVVPDTKAAGVIIAQAGAFGGWALYMDDGRVVHDYNFFGLSHAKVASPSALPPGRHTIVYEFVPDEAKPGTGGRSILSVNGAVVAEGRIPKTQPFAFSADEGVDVGVDNETMVSDDYRAGATDFSGEIVKVTVAQL
jgi:arylsulfatase